MGTWINSWVESPGRGGSAPRSESLPSIYQRYPFHIPTCWVLREILKGPRIPKRQFSLLFSILQLVKFLPFDIPPAWNRYPFRAEPPRIVHYRQYSSPSPNPPGVEYNWEKPQWICLKTAQRIKFSKQSILLVVCVNIGLIYRHFRHFYFPFFFLFRWNYSQLSRKRTPSGIEKVSVSKTVRLRELFP